MASPGDDLDSDRGREELLADLHARLAATGERPVEREAARWLGEAEAVAADVACGDAPAGAIATRIEQVRELLSHVEATGDDEADRHVEAARGLVDAVEERL